MPAPFDLYLGMDGLAPSTIYRALRDLSEPSLVEWVRYVSSRAQHERLWYLADRGVRLAANLAGQDLHRSPACGVWARRPSCAAWGAWSISRSREAFVGPAG